MCPKTMPRSDHIKGSFPLKTLRDHSSPFQTLSQRYPKETQHQDCIAAYWKEQSLAVASKTSPNRPGAFALADEMCVSTSKSQHIVIVSSWYITIGT